MQEAKTFFLTLLVIKPWNPFYHTIIQGHSIILNTKIKEKFSLVDFGDRISLCSPDCPGTYYVQQASLKLTEIWPALPPEF